MTYKTDITLTKSTHIGRPFLIGGTVFAFSTTDTYTLLDVTNKKVLGKVSTLDDIKRLTQTYYGSKIQLESCFIQVGDYSVTATNKPLQELERLVLANGDIIIRAVQY